MQAKGQLAIRLCDFGLVVLSQSVDSLSQEGKTVIRRSLGGYWTVSCWYFCLVDGVEWAS